jgi:hypothetical protein
MDAVARLAPSQVRENGGAASCNGEQTDLFGAAKPAFLQRKFCTPPSFVSVLQFRPRPVFLFLKVTGSAATLDLELQGTTTLIGAVNAAPEANRWCFRGSARPATEAVAISGLQISAVIPIEIQPGTAHYHITSKLGEGAWARCITPSGRIGGHPESGL